MRIPFSAPIEDRAYAGKEVFEGGRVYPRDYSEVMRLNSEYQKKVMERAEAVRENASRRMRGLAQITVPEKPSPPEFPFAYIDGDYEGLVLGGADNVPKGAVIKWGSSADKMAMDSGSKSTFESGGFEEASSSPILADLIEKRCLPPGGWKASSVSDAGLTILFENKEDADDFVECAKGENFSASNPLLEGGGYWKTIVGVSTEAAPVPIEDRFYAQGEKAVFGRGDYDNSQAKTPPRFHVGDRVADTKFGYSGEIYRLIGYQPAFNAEVSGAGWVYEVQIIDSEGNKHNKVAIAENALRKAN